MVPGMENLKSQLGPSARMADRFQDIASEYFDSGGIDTFVSIARILVVFDKSKAAHILGAAGSIMGNLPDKSARSQALKIIHDMGRPRWQVMSTALCVMEEFTRREPVHTLQWLSHGLPE